MAKITFKTKVKTYGIMGDDSISIEYIKVPVLTKKHCDMNAFRSHKKYGGLANSTLFPNILARIRNEVFGSGSDIDLDKLPDNVSIDTTGFLAVITIDV